MHTIDIHEFIDYDSASIYKYIMLQNTTEYKVTMYKCTDNPVEDPFDVFWEYYMAAFIGQKLFEISDTYSYYVPPVNATDIFKFFIKISDPEKLIDVLSFVIPGFFVKDEDVADKFQQQAHDFFQEAFDNEELLVGCWGLLEIANRHLAEDPTKTSEKP